MAKFGKARSFADLKRRGRGYSELRRILIVCEGSKTEPNYFRGLLKWAALRAVSVVVIGEQCESAPISVFKYAEKRFAEDGGYDEVYCVFDRDRHPTFDAAVEACQSHRSKVFTAVSSYPCFEFWVLLHFKYTRAPFVAQGPLSPGDVVVKAVKAEWPAYSKGMADAFPRLHENGKTSTAIAHARRARSDADATGNPNPSTGVGELVDRIIQLSEDQLKPKTGEKP